MLIAFPQCDLAHEEIHVDAISELGCFKLAETSTM